jgi:hypothetical protein
VLLTVGPPRQRQLRLSVPSTAFLAEVEGAVLSHLNVVGARDGGGGHLLTAETQLPLEYLDTTFSEWCVLTAAALPGLSQAVRMRTAAAAAAAAGSSGTRELRVGSPPGSECQTPRGAAACWASEGLAGIGNSGGSRRQLLGGDAGTGGSGSRSLLQALAEEDLTALPLAAIWLEERLKARARDEGRAAVQARCCSSQPLGSCRLPDAPGVINVPGRQMRPKAAMPTQE